MPSILDIYDQYYRTLESLTQLLTSTIKSNHTVKEILATIHTSRGVTITKSAYYQRLRKPQYFPLVEIEHFAIVLQTPELLQLAEKAQLLMASLPLAIDQLIASQNLSNDFISRKLGINRATFYKKQNDPINWKRAQLERIVIIVETIASLSNPKG